MREFWIFILPWALIFLGLWLGSCAVVLAYRIRERRRRAERRDKNA